MTFEEAVAQCDPFAVSYIWSDPCYKGYGHYKSIVVVRTSDWKYTSFNFHNSQYEERIRKVDTAYYHWELFHQERWDRIAQWHTGGIDAMVAWATELFL